VLNNVMHLLTDATETFLNSEEPLLSPITILLAENKSYCVEISDELIQSFCLLIYLLF
jgi:hypothetical protein